jgi:beta-galactosidase GanA
LRTVPFAETLPRMVYRKEADRLIVRDVARRLREMRRETGSATWQWAVMATYAAHPEWFRHHPDIFAVEPLLREGDVDVDL